MEALNLVAKTRTIEGKKVKNLRLAGIVPAVVYGNGIASRSIELDLKSFDKVFSKAGESSLIDLDVDGKTVKVLVHDVQRDPLREDVTHVDFREVNMKEKLEANIMLKFVGEAPAVKALGGILVRNLDVVAVRCLPGDLVHEIEVDISGLKELEDAVKVSDLIVPKGLELLASPDETVIVVSTPISEEELAALNTQVVADVTAVKSVVEEKKAERAAAKETEDKK